MAEKKTIELEVKSNIEGSISELKALKRQLKDTAAGSAEFKALYNQIDDLEDKIKSAKNTSSDWVDSLESAGGPLGALGAGINRAKVATQSFGGALKATGIGLIVSLLAGLAAAFSDNEGAMKKVQPLLEGMRKIFQGVFRAVEPLFNMLVDLAISALPMVSKAFEVVYSSVTAVFQSLGSLGSALNKLIHGDFKGAWESAKESVNGFSKNYDKSVENFQKGTKEMTKTEKEESDKRAEARKKAQEEQAAKDKAARDKKLADEKAANQKQLEEQKAFQDELLKAQQEMNGQRVQQEIQDKLDTQQSQEDRLAGITAEVDGIEDERQRGKDRKLASDKQNVADEIELEKNRSQAIADIKNNLNNIISGLEASGIAKTKAGQIASKAIALTQIGIDSAIALSKASTLANAEGVAAQAALPFVPGIGTIARVLSYASTTASVIGNISRAKQLLSGGSVGGGASSAPSGGGMPSSAPPQFNVVGASSTNQLAQTIGQKQGQPIKAYVVGSEVTTQQSLDRNIVSTATL